MNFKAATKTTPLNLSLALQKLVPRMVEAVSEGCAAVVAEAQLIVPVDTGDLRESIHASSVELVGTVVQGHVTADSGHATYVEYGTGERGAASPGAGAGPYTPGWPGMPAQPYMRPALDVARPAIREAFRKQGFRA